jgi:N-acetylglucosaminyl transferase component (Gpi1)
MRQSRLPGWHPWGIHLRISVLSPDAILVLICVSQYLTVEFTRQALIWLDNWPVGLKLNTELSRFLCLSFIGINEICSGEQTDFIRVILIPTTS